MHTNHFPLLRFHTCPFVVASQKPRTVVFTTANRRECTRITSLFFASIRVHSWLLRKNHAQLFLKPRIDANAHESLPSSSCLFVVASQKPRTVVFKTANRRECTRITSLFFVSIRVHSWLLRKNHAQLFLKSRIDANPHESLPSSSRPFV